MPKKELNDQKKVVKTVKKAVSTKKTKIEKVKEAKVVSKKTTKAKKEATGNKLKEAKEKEIKISNEPMSVVLSTNGWIKSNKGSLEKIDNLTFKSGDSFLDYLNIDNDKQVAFFDQKGFLN